MVTRLHGYKVTRLQRYNPERSAAPPFGGTGEQFPIPKRKEMTQNQPLIQPSAVPSRAGLRSHRGNDVAR